MLEGAIEVIRGLGLLLGESAVGKDPFVLGAAGLGALLLAFDEGLEGLDAVQDGLTRLVHFLHMQPEARAVWARVREVRAVRAREEPLNNRCCRSTK